LLIILTARLAVGKKELRENADHYLFLLKAKTAVKVQQKDLD